MAIVQFKRSADVKIMSDIFLCRFYAMVSAECHKMQPIWHKQQQNNSFNKNKHIHTPHQTYITYFGRWIQTQFVCAPFTWLNTFKPKLNFRWIKLKYPYHRASCFYLYYPALHTIQFKMTLYCKKWNNKQKR